MGNSCPPPGYVYYFTQENDPNTVIRPWLDLLGDYAKRHQFSIVLISHMSKPTKGDYSALERLLGSSDFRNAARSIVIVSRDPNDKETRVFAHGKNSIGEEGHSQKYHISGAGVTYDGPSELTADEILSQAAQSRNKPAVTLTAVMRRLEELLGEEGAATLEQVETLQTLESIAKSTLYNARKELALQTVSIGKPPARKTWWVRADIDVEWFKITHSPPPEQIELST